MFQNQRKPGFQPMARFGAMAFLALVVAGLTACGGGGGGTGIPPKPLDPAKLPGAWISTSSSGTAYLVVAPSSTASFHANLLATPELNQVEGTLNLSGSAVTGTGLAYFSSIPSSTQVPSGVTSLGIDVTGTATASPDTLSLALASRGVSPTSSTAFTPDAAANNPVALADLAGTYRSPAAANSGYADTQVVIAPPAAGATTTTFTGVVDPGGANAPVTGNISVWTGTPGTPAPNNLFSVAMTAPTGQGTTINVTGVAYLRSGTPSTLIVMASDGNNPASTTARQVSSILTRQ